MNKREMNYVQSKQRFLETFIFITTLLVSASKSIIILKERTAWIFINKTYSAVVDLCIGQFVYTHLLHLTSKLFFITLKYYL